LKIERVIITNSSVLEWALENDRKINDLLYNTIFDFSKSDKKSVTLLRLYSFSDKDQDGTDVVIDFKISKKELFETIDKLLKAYERYEEYEKCAEILKLQKSLVD
jgi:hypothetical protein